MQPCFAKPSLLECMRVLREHLQGAKSGAGVSEAHPVMRGWEAAAAGPTRSRRPNGLLKGAVVFPLFFF